MAKVELAIDRYLSVHPLVVLTTLLGGCQLECGHEIVLGPAARWFAECADKTVDLLPTLIVHRVVDLFVLRWVEIGLVLMRL